MGRIEETVTVAETLTEKVNEAAHGWGHWRHLA